MSTLKNIQLNWLRTFEAAGRHLSFSEAAGQLSMSQSAVSQQINLLELKLGRKLFVRQNRSIQLTAAGRAYLGVVREALKLIELGMDGIFNTAAQGVLELSVNNSFAQLWLAPRYRHFTDAHPQVSARMYGTSWEADAPPTTAELKIRYGAGVWPGFDSTELLCRDLRAYCSRGVASELRRSGGLGGLKLIEVLGTPVGWNDWIAESIPAREFAAQRIHVDSFAIAAKLAVQGVGIALLGEELIHGSILRNELVSPLDRRVKDRFGFYLLRPRDRSLSGAAHAFCQWLEQARSAGSPAEIAGPIPEVDDPTLALLMRA